MNKVIGILVLMIATISVANESPFKGHTIGYTGDTVIVAGIGTFTLDEYKALCDTNNFVSKDNSDLYKCAENDFVYPTDTNDTYEVRLNIAHDLATSRMSNIRQVTQKVGGEIRVYFEICGSGFSVADKYAIEKEIQEAIKKILERHYNK